MTYNIQRQRCVCEGGSGGLWWKKVGEEWRGGDRFFTNFLTDKENNYFIIITPKKSVNILLVANQT